MNNDIEKARAELSEKIAMIDMVQDATRHLLAKLTDRLVTMEGKMRKFERTLFPAEASQHERDMIAETMKALGEETIAREGEKLTVRMQPTGFTMKPRDGDEEWQRTSWGHIRKDASEEVSRKDEATVARRERLGRQVGGDDLPEFSQEEKARLYDANVKRRHAAIDAQLFASTREAIIQDYKNANDQAATIDALNVRIRGYEAADLASQGERGSDLPIASRDDLIACIGGHLKTIKDQAATITKLEKANALLKVQRDNSEAELTEVCAEIAKGPTILIDGVEASVYIADCLAKVLGGAHHD